MRNIPSFFQKKSPSACFTQVKHVNFRSEPTNSGRVDVVDNRTNERKLHQCSTVWLECESLRVYLFTAFFEEHQFTQEPQPWHDIDSFRTLILHKIKGHTLKKPRRHDKNPKHFLKIRAIQSKETCNYHSKFVSFWRGHSPPRHESTSISAQFCIWSARRLFFFLFDQN